MQGTRKDPGPVPPEPLVSGEKAGALRSESGLRRTVLTIAWGTSSREGLAFPPPMTRDPGDGGTEDSA